MATVPEKNRNFIISYMEYLHSYYEDLDIDYSKELILSYKKYFDSDLSKLAIQVAKELDIDYHALLKTQTFSEINLHNLISDYYFENQILSNSNYRKQLAKTLQALSIAEPYLPSKVSNPIRHEVVKQQHAQSFSFSDITGLASLIITILAFLTTFLPDNQLQQIIDNQETQIALQEQLLEEERQQNQALLLSVSLLSSSLQDLDNEVDVLRNQLEDIQNSDNLDLNPDNGQTLETAQNAQE